MTPPKRSHHKKKPARTNNGAAPATRATRFTPADFDAMTPPATVPLELPPVVMGTTAAPAVASDALAALERAELITAPAPEKSIDLEAAPATRAALAKTAALEKMCGVACSGLFDFVALWTSLDQVRLDKDEETDLGELGAPALEPYMGDYAKHAPLVAFLLKLGSVVTSKVFIVRALKADKLEAAPNA